MKDYLRHYHSDRTHLGLAKGTLTQNPKTVTVEIGGMLAVEALGKTTRRSQHAEEGYTEEQIIAALKQFEAGDKAADICRRLGVRQATFYMWKRQCAGWACRSYASCDLCAKNPADLCRDS